MMVDGKAIPLGIPGRGTGPTNVNAVADIPLKRAGTAAEAAGGILLMCCPYSSYITGHTLVVTGVSLCNCRPSAVLINCRAEESRHVYRNRTVRPNIEIYHSYKTHSENFQVAVHLLKV